MLKILLVVPPIRVGNKRILGDFCPPAIPLGLAYIAAVLESRGFSPHILDLSFQGADFKRLNEFLARVQPEVVGITSMTSNFENAVAVARLVKNQNPSTKVIIGGVHATFLHQEVLSAYQEIDAVIRYEGEFTTCEFIQALEKGGNLEHVKGISFRRDGKVVSTPLRDRITDLDVLPFPAHHLLEPSVEEYIRFYGKRNFPVITTRGCPFGCIYCSTMAFHGRNYRTRSVANVVGELEYLIDRFKAENISFVDDNFTMQPHRVILLCEEIKKRNLQVEWGCSARVDQVPKKLLNKMKDAGCTDLFFGIESVSQQVLDKVKKGYSVQQAKRAVLNAEKLGIRTHCSFIIGLPGESSRTLANMKSFVAQTKPSGRVLPNLLVIFPGTELSERKNEYSDQKPVSFANMTKTQLEIVTTFYKINFGLSELIRVIPPKISIE